MNKRTPQTKQPMYSLYPRWSNQYLELHSLNVSDKFYIRTSSLRGWYIMFHEGRPFLARPSSGKCWKALLAILAGERVELYPNTTFLAPHGLPEFLRPMPVEETGDQAAPEN